MNKNYTEQSTVLILSGGRGSRLGNSDKGLLQLAGKPLIKHVIDSLPPQWPIVISANRNLDQYAAFGHRCISDPNAEFAGPMQAILTALNAVKTDYLVVVPCDTPRLPADLAERLVAALDASHDASYARYRQRGHYCCLAAKTEALRQLNTARSMYQLLEQLHAIPVDIDADDNTFLNINNPEDLAQAEQLLAMPHTKKP